MANSWYRRDSGLWTPGRNEREFMRCMPGGFVRPFGGSGAVAPFVPTDIAGCVLWLKADAGLYTDAAKTTPVASDGDVVGAWEDQSGSGNDATQATTSAKPLYKVSILNGLPVVRFDGSDDFLVPTNVIGAASDWTVFGAVICPSLTTAGNSLLAFQNNDGTYATSLYVQPSRGGTRQYGYYDGAAREFGAAADGTQLLCWVLDQANSATFWKNASQVNGTKAYTQRALGVVADKGRISGTAGDGLFYQDLAELIIYNSALSTANRQLVEAYINTRWGLW